MNTALTRTPFGSFTFEHEGNAIHNPTRSSCGRFAVEPSTYGFEVTSTGGGCTAWARDFTLDGRPVYMLLTDEADAALLQEGATSFTVGVYEHGSTETIACWEQAAEGTLEDAPPHIVIAEGEQA
jgi:hypothetical protein